MTSKLDLRSSGSTTPLAMPEEADTTNINDPERGLQPHSGDISVRSVDTDAEPTASSSSQASATGGYLRHKTSQIFDTVVNKGISGLIVKKTPDEVIIAPALSTLITAYANSDIAANIKAEGKALQREVVRSDNNQAPVAAGISGSLPDVVLETSMLRGRKRASYGTQFRILSGRAFKNLYRDPALLTAHYTSAIALAGAHTSFADKCTEADSVLQSSVGCSFTMSRTSASNLFARIY